MKERLRIERVRLRELRLPLRSPFQISGGTMRVRRSLIVELESEGAVGYGEAAPFEQPFYSSETFGSALALYRELLIERLRGRAFGSVDELEAELGRGVRGNPMARCGIENAFWDLMAARRGAPLTTLIGERMEALGVAAERRASRPRIASGVALGIPEGERLETLAEGIQEARAEGYQRVKIKIRPGWDVEPCRCARRALGPDFLLWADANAAYDLTADGGRLRALDEFGLAFLEQPLQHDDLLDHARLARLIRTPICLDESLTSARTACQALEVGASRIWNVKVQRLGGLAEAIRVYALAVESGVALWGGTMPESGIGAQPMLALGAFSGFTYPADIEPSRRWYGPGVDPVELTMSPEGWIEVPATAGLGPRLDPEAYAAHTRPLAV